MRRASRFLCTLVVLSFMAIGWRLPEVAADDWLPVLPEELSMKDYTPSPGAHAVLLYREVRTDDVNSVEE